MPKKSEAGLQKHTLNLYAGDMEKLRELFPGQEPTVLVRRIIRSTIENIENSAEPPQLDLKVTL